MEKIADTTTSALIKGGLRSVANSFPVFGSLAQAWNEYESHVKNKRLDELIENLHALVACLQVDLTEFDQRTKDEFPTLMLKTVEKVQREASENKRRTLARALLSNIAAGSQRSYEDKINV